MGSRINLVSARYHWRNPVALQLLVESLAMQGPTAISLVAIRTAEGAWRCERVAALLRERVRSPQTGQHPVRVLFCEAGPQAVARVRAAVLEGEADAAVHSAEDLPCLDHEKLEVIAILPRGDPRDALYSEKGASFAQLHPGARVGVAGAARAAQLGELRPDLWVVALDGDAPALDRVGRDLDAAVVPAMVLAQSGRPASGLFALEKLVPGAGRGTIAIEVRAGERGLLPLLAELDDPRSRLQWTAERVVLRRLAAWPASSLGVIAEVTYGSVTLHGALATGAPMPLVRAHRSGPAAMATQVADSVAGALLLQEGPGTRLAGQGR